ncbi:unnamed protein product [Cyclocybe aegerita]|uniref:Reverse transcriptase/retrotransposon-derived protein RNase H-like domain-containing protein n=1 Tax=Cyclocybe aegerita TaxID=1973307 RepID=A0A8S0W575_CYCAE|nr:unnamed protein product [Cyclocybe aegerita]
MFDDGAMVNAIDAGVFEQVKNRLSVLEVSGKLLRMADGRIVPSVGVWQGMVSVGKAQHTGTFEVFDSGKAWVLLFGKLLLEGFGAIHDYGPDEIWLPVGDKGLLVHNQFNDTSNPGSRLMVGLTTDIKQQVMPREDNLAPAASQTSDAGAESYPFNPARVKAILEDITIGADLSHEQRQEVLALLAEFADCFALSMSEVIAVKGAEHQLNIPDGATFKTKVNQQPLSQPQKVFYDEVIDKMLEADIIQPIPHRDVKCCGATTLAKKAHEGAGLTLEELQHRVNDNCTEAGFAPAFEHLLPPQPVQSDNPSESTVNSSPNQKWCVCQDFAELNNVTKVPPMPQGDIRMKQQRLSGHRWVTTFDFASGFYARAIPEDQQPYVCFYVQGRGYFSYERMPFGLTGAPSTFADMTAKALGNLVGSMIELFVDDGGMAGYAGIAQPLTDLQRQLELPKLKGKAAYWRVMKGCPLEGKWTKEHNYAFLLLKAALTNEPVLQGPKYDGTPFIVTTDGCKFGFTGMLTQKHTTVLPNGKEVTRLHLVGFASKRTSVTEEKYKPFILEFAALKYSLDKFSDVVWGFPVELETDCQALQDHLLNGKINSTHARWRDGVLAHQIVNVRHQPGRLNPVADGISCKFVNLPYEDGDSHKWTVSEDWEA